MPVAPELTFSREHLAPGTRVCVAVSGGADSVALLLTMSWQRDTLGIGLSAAHVHHNLRGGEADADQAFVTDLCRRLDIELHLHSADTPAHIAATGEGIEEAARTLRYRYFHHLLAERRVDAVLTAHTQDDQAETVLMKLLRGAWTDGLSGIAPVLKPEGKAAAGVILRPLLETTRAEIETFLQQQGQAWRTDSTNADPAFTRNRIRHQLLPELRTYNPAITQTLAHLAGIAREEEARWQGELARLLPQLLLPGKPVRGGGRAVATTGNEASCSIELERLRTLDPATRRRVLRAAARQLGARLSFDETARLLELAGLPSAGSRPHTVSARAGAVLHLPDGLRAERSPRELRLHRTA